MTYSLRAELTDGTDVDLGYGSLAFCMATMATELENHSDSIESIYILNTSDLCVFEHNAGNHPIVADMIFQDHTDKAVQFDCIGNAVRMFQLMLSHEPTLQRLSWNEGRKFVTRINPLKVQIVPF